jgi:hypothetical protein
VKKLALIIPIGIALLLLTKKATAKSDTLKNLTFKLLSFKFNLKKSLISILSGKLTFDASLRLTNLQNEAVEVSNIYLKMFINGSNIANIKHDIVNIPKLNSLTFNPTIEVDINNLGSTIKNIYQQLKKDFTSSTGNNKLQIITNGVIALKSEIDKIKGNFLIDGNMNVENVPISFKQNISL